jgi:hypothetical protein
MKDGSASCGRCVIENFIKLLLGALIDIDHHWEGVTEAGKSEHIILRIPRNVGDEVQESALILSSSLRSIGISRSDIPDVRSTVF